MKRGNKFSTITITPETGGKLMANASGETIGVENYSVKRDMRRFLDREIRREGHEYLWPNEDFALVAQKLNAPSGVTLLWEARHPTGLTAILAATPTTIYRYFRLNPANYVDGLAPFYYFQQSGLNTPIVSGDYTLDDGGSAYFTTTDYIEDANGEWIVIGDGFSPDGHRWEAINLNGYTVLNNGVDLPVTYRVDELKVVPIYELREQGIASVGTIAEYNGILMAGDMAEIKTDALNAIMDVISSGVETASATSNTVTASGDVFTAKMVGQYLYWDSGETRKIASFVDAHTVTVDTFGAIASGKFSIENPAAYTAFTDEGNLNRIKWRVLWSMFGEPRRWGAVIPCSATANSRSLVLQYPVRSLEPGNDITVIGADALEGNLSTTVTYVFAGNRTVLMSDPAVTAISNTSLERTDAIESIVGFNDLEDDSSAVLKMLALRNVLVIYRDTSIFFGTYTGDVNTPFQFRRVYRGPKSLCYRYTLINVNGTSHFYAGRNGFLKFDLIQQTPMEVPHGEAAQNIMFDQVSVGNESAVFAVDNAITKEVMVCFPSSSPDKALCFDYLNDTVSTMGTAYTAATLVQKPTASPPNGPTELWFIAGTADGQVLRYGKTDAKQARWGGNAMFNRLGGPYDSVLEFGLGDFANVNSEKDVESYVLDLASTSPHTPVLFELFGARNATEALRLLASKLITDPKVLVPMFFRQFLFKDRLTISGQDNPFELKGRIWVISGVDSRSFSKRP